MTGMSTDLTQNIADAATKPAEVKTDEASVKARSLTDLIEADKYLTRKTITKNPLKAIRVTTLEPPGTT